MNIGIYVKSLAPPGAAQNTFQATLFAGLERVAPSDYHFIVLTRRLPADIENTGSFTYLDIDSARFRPEPSRAESSRVARLIRRVRRKIGGGNAPGSSGSDRRARSQQLLEDELRRLNVRLIWNMSQHELPTFLPYIRTVWDINQRIYSMYPEYSYTRFTFDGLDSSFEKSLARASFVVTGTEEGKRQIAGIFGVYEGKIRVIPFPTPLLPDAEEPDASVPEQSEPFLFYPARLWPHKNHVVIIAALSVLKKELGRRVRCVFCGADEGNLEYVMKYAAQLGVADQVQYVGKVTTAELARYYRGAAALVYASAVGPDNLPPLEAMSVGCPVITADVAGAREQYGDAVLFFDPLDEQSLANQVMAVLEGTGIREELVAKGYHRARQWTADDYVRSVVAVFDEFRKIARAWERNDSVFT